MKKTTIRKCKNIYLDFQSMTSNCRNQQLHPILQAIGDRATKHDKNVEQLLTPLLAITNAASSMESFIQPPKTNMQEDEDEDQAEPSEQPAEPKIMARKYIQLQGCLEPGESLQMDRKNTGARAELSRYNGCLYTYQTHLRFFLEVEGEHPRKLRGGYKRPSINTFPPTNEQIRTTARMEDSTPKSNFMMWNYKCYSAQ